MLLAGLGTSLATDLGLAPAWAGEEASLSFGKLEPLVALMQEFGGNVTHAAERAGMERESLHRLLKRYGVRSDDFKRSE